MPTVTPLPDAKKAAMDYVRAHADVVALGARVVSSFPGDKTDTQWVQATLIDAEDLGRKHEHLIAYDIQFDCYAGKTVVVNNVRTAGGWPEANALAYTVRAVLKSWEGATSPLVVSGVAFRRQFELLDTTMEPARERVVLEAVVFGHA